MDWTLPHKRMTVDEILNAEDEFGLLDVKQPAAPLTSGNLLADRFNDITEFYIEQGRLPQKEGDSLREQLLAARLDALLKDKSQHDMLQQYDVYGLLDMETDSEEVVSPSELVTSLDDILNGEDEFGLLSFDEPDIFTLKNVKHTRKSKQDGVARRQQCADFYRFESLFKTVKECLDNHTFSTVRFVHTLKMNKGDFFILNGITGYVHTVGESSMDQKPGNPRLHLIFDNGTELHMLYLSLTHGLVRDKTGRKFNLNGRVLLPDDTLKQSGLVYVLATESQHPALQPYKPNLYKIGFTEGTVENRIRLAEKDATFLEAPVRVVATTQCFGNVNAQKLEWLVHGFLGKQRLDITLKDVRGRTHHPREWFNAPLETILEVIERILDGTIVQYRMNNTTGQIVPKVKV